jgi:hypothetical protein
MKKHSINAGNALWFILIAIFLLGALTMLITRTGSQTEETGSAERVSIEASEIVRYTAGMVQIVDRLRLNGCSESQISFESSKWTDNGYTYANPNAPADKSCHVFDAAGGGLAFQTIPGGTTYTDYHINSSNIVTGIGSNGAGGRDLLVQAAGLSEELCRQINRSLGISSFAIDGLNGNQQFTGSFSVSGSVIGDDNTNPAYIQGKKAACLGTLAGGGYPVTYVFYQVLIGR